MIGALGPSNFNAWRPNLTARVATVQGGCYQLDELWTDSHTTDVNSSFDNVIAVTTAGIVQNAMFIAENVYAASNRGTFVGHGACKVLVNGSVTKGDRLIPVNAQAYLQSTTTTNTTAVAIAHGSNTSGTALIDARFVGGFTKI